MPIAPPHASQVLATNRGAGSALGGNGSQDVRFLQRPSVFYEIMRREFRVDRQGLAKIRKTVAGVFSMRPLHQLVPD